MRAVRKSPFSKMMVTVAFAPGHRYVPFHQDQTSLFLKNAVRARFYMQRVMLFPDATDFSNVEAWMLSPVWEVLVFSRNTTQLFKLS
ncbi:hypothetical protein Plhal304r1_c004g0016311 [Plasmopara halstedii]